MKIGENGERTNFGLFELFLSLVKVWIVAKIVNRVVSCECSSLLVLGVQIVEVFVFWFEDTFLRLKATGV